MNNLISNEELGIDFEIKEILQEDIEVYERGLAKYLNESEFTGSSASQATLVSAVIMGAIDAKFIPTDIVASKKDVKASSPQKMSFLAAKITQILDTAKSGGEIGFEFEVPEITQGDLEEYERVRNRITKDLELPVYQMAKANSIMVQIGIEIGWITKKILPTEIGKSKPNVIKYLANQMTEALMNARTIPGE